MTERLTWALLEWVAPLATVPGVLVYMLQPATEVRLVVGAGYAALAAISVLGMLAWFAWRAWGRRSEKGGSEV